MALRQTISQLGSTLIGAVSTRLELFALEAGQQKASLITLFSMVFGALLFGSRQSGLFLLVAGGESENGNGENELFHVFLCA